MRRYIELIHEYCRCQVYTYRHVQFTLCVYSKRNCIKNMTCSYSCKYDLHWRCVSQSKQSILIYSYMSTTEILSNPSSRHTRKNNTYILWSCIIYTLCQSIYTRFILWAKTMKVVRRTSSWHNSRQKNIRCRIVSTMIHILYT